MNTSLCLVSYVDRTTRKLSSVINGCISHKCSLQRVFYNVSEQVLSNGYRWAASATSPGAFEANLLTGGIPEGVSVQMLQTCLI